jgi:phosphoribosylformylglycinamidine cyclo-ligase
VPKPANPTAKPITYADAGVNISRANQTKQRIKYLAHKTFTRGVLSEIGGFGGLFSVDKTKYVDPVLVSSVDGVGTKLKVAFDMKLHSTVGADLVNHCVNDILVLNASPLFFLDYLAVGKLDPAVAAEIVGGCAEACRRHDCALLGGETAEMPGLYAPGHFDLAGTIVGLVEIADLPRSDSVEPGDAIVGLPAVGLHTNGYSLARSLIPSESLRERFEGGTYGDALLAEHPSYSQPVRAIEGVAHVKAMAHITGGGLLENVPRTLPENVKAVFEQERWTVPPIQRELVARGHLGHEERYRVFNMGVGYTLIVPGADAAKAIAAAPGAAVIGRIEARTPHEPRVEIHPARDA